MRNWKSTVLAAVVAGTGLAGSAMAAPSYTGLDGDLDSSLFTHKYEGDVLPQNAGLGFVLNDPNGVYGTASDPASLGTSGGVTYLRIDTDTNLTVPANQYGDAYNYAITGGTATNWDPNPAGGFTAEFRAIVRANNNGTYGATVRLGDGNSWGLHEVWKNQYLSELSYVTTPDNSDTWHTFRIASYSPDGSSANQVYKVWRDGVELVTSGQNTFSGTFLVFGDYVSGSAEVNWDIDYLRWTTEGAYSPAPVPEPSTAMGLLLAGSGLMLRRRKESR
jgi:hypothetical protein